MTLIGSREDQAAVSVTVAGTDLGIWDKRSGGLLDSSETKYRPGNMGPPYVLGGAVTTENVTVSRNYQLARDHSLVPFLKAQRGKGEMAVKHQPLDSDGNTYGAPTVWKGVLKSVNLPEHDSEGEGAAMIELEMSTEGEVG